jgi:hypothetical protein
VAIDPRSLRLIGQPKIPDPFIYTDPESGERTAFPFVATAFFTEDAIRTLITYLVGNLVPHFVAAMTAELQRRGALPVTREDSASMYALYAQQAPEEEKTCPECAEIGTLEPDATFQHWDWKCDAGHRWLSRDSISRAKTASAKAEAQAVAAGVEPPEPTP